MIEILLIALGLVASFVVGQHVERALIFAALRQAARSARSEDQVAVNALARAMRGRAR